jgi:hypothetical protein
VSIQTFSDVLRAGKDDGPTLTAAAEALLYRDYAFPVDWWKVERALRLTLFGRASNAVTTPGTIQFRLRWGGLAGTLLADSGALTQNVAVQANKLWTAQFLIICRGVGTVASGGLLFATGWAMRGNKSVAALADMAPDMIPPSAPAAVAIDTTAAGLLSITGQPSLTTASITVHQYLLEATP